MSAYRIASRAHIRGSWDRRRIAPWIGERRRLWLAAIAWYTPAGRARKRQWVDQIFDMIHGADAAAVISVADRVSNQIADQALRAAWRPAQGDA